MQPKNKAMPCALLLVALSGAPSGCSAQLGDEGNARVVRAEDGGEEEVLLEDEDLDDFGRPKSDGVSGEGGFLVSVTYLGMMIGSALLPFLLLL